MALGHLIWITGQCFMLISLLTTQLTSVLILISVSTPTDSHTCNSGLWRWIFIVQTQWVSCHISFRHDSRVCTLTTQGQKDGGRCCIDASGHWVWLLAFCQYDWSSELQNLTVSLESSCTAGLNVCLWFVDRFVRCWIIFFHFLLPFIKCLMVRFAWGRCV